MTATAKKKLSIPTLEERVEALMQEVEDALEMLAELRRPKGPCGMPKPLMRRMLDAKGFGDCPCRSYLAAVKEEQH